MKKFIYGFGSCLLLVAAFAIPYFWPDELNLVFNGLFWSSALSFALCIFIIGHLFYTKGGSSRNVRFFFGIALILSASVLFRGLEQIASNASFWQPHFKANYSSFFVYLIEFIVYAKNIVSFGFAALGASISANAINERA